jgi:sialidase-1
VLSKGPIDLLFEEAAVNDLHNGRTPIEQVRAMEGIVRHARQSNPAMDIVLMHFADPQHIADYNEGNRPHVIQNHERVANHYDVPSINLAQEVHDRLRVGQFDWARDFVNLHPSPFGQRLYYGSIKRLLDRAWSDGVASKTKTKAYPMPKPLDPQCYAGGTFVSVTEVNALDGFAIDPDCHPQNGGGFRPGFVDVPMLVGEKPGDSFEFSFKGQAIGLFVAAGPDAGIIEYRIDDGTVQTLDTFTKWSGGLNIPWAYILDADLTPGSHTLFLEISEENSKSKGHTVRIRDFLVNRTGVGNQGSGVGNQGSGFSSRWPGDWQLVLKGVGYAVYVCPYINLFPI